MLFNDVPDPGLCQSVLIVQDIDTLVHGHQAHLCPRVTGDGQAEGLTRLIDIFLDCGFDFKRSHAGVLNVHPHRV
uniref:Uncharacterized protein n=1 Tax=Anguilla anguilla TaxID=7936 RepID=A0A0E9WID4_ANGAN